MAIILKNEVKIFLQGWQKAESREEISTQLDKITNNVITLKNELNTLKSTTGKLVERVKQEQILGIEKARMDLARRVGLSI